MKNKSGFTLIEILIVIAIIGILSVAFIPSILGAPAKARDTQRIEDVQKIADFLLLEYISDGTTYGGQFIRAASGLGASINDNIADFGGIFPLDPDPSSCSISTTDTDCTTYLGQYALSAAPGGATSGFVYGVATRVELTENGNAASWNTATLADEGQYYVTLIQK